MELRVSPTAKPILNGRNVFAEVCSKFPLLCANVRPLQYIPATNRLQFHGLTILMHGIQFHSCDWAIFERA